MDENHFIGTWKLAYWKNRDETGRVSYPYGNNALGYLSYTPDGFIFAVLSKENRESFGNADSFQATDMEKISSYDSYFSYCGKYEIKGQTVIHHIRTCSFPNWNGMDLLRNFTFSDNALLLSTQPFQIDGLTQVSELLWEKAD
jgi:hypothetical protein